MTITQNPSTEQLCGKISELESQVNERKNTIDSLVEKIQTLEEQLAWFKRQLFGKRSEKIISHVNEEQLTFEGFEIPQPVEVETKQVGAHSRRKSNRNGQDTISLPPDLPVQTTILDIPEEEKICQKTGVPLVKIGEETTYKLAHQPGSYYLKEIIRPKYAHPQNEEKGIQTADLPDSLLPKCRADESLLAEIITRKFVDHLPLYRIAESLGRENIKISRRLLSQWVVRSAMALKPLYVEMKKQILSSSNIFIDETPVNLLEKKKCRTAYIWVIVGGNEADPPYRVYDFRENRRHENAFDLLEDYVGIFHSDKYGAYQKLAESKQAIWCPCWSHIRRKFFEAESGDARKSRMVSLS